MSAAKGGAPNMAEDLDDYRDDDVIVIPAPAWNAWAEESVESERVPRQATSSPALDAARKACAESAEVKAANAACNDAWAAWSAAELALRTGPWPSREDANDAWDAERAARVLLERAWAARSSAYDRVIRGEPNR